jgi:hypothetical protein
MEFINGKTNPVKETSGASRYEGSPSLILTPRAQEKSRRRVTSLFRQDEQDRKVSGPRLHIPSIP